MGVMDKMMFWKKEDNLDDLGDLGDLGSFDSPSGAGSHTKETGLGDFDSPPGTGMHSNEAGLGGLDSPSNPPASFPDHSQLHQSTPLANHPATQQDMPANPQSPDSLTSADHPNFAAETGTPQQTEHISPSHATQNLGPTLHQQGTPITPPGMPQHMQTSAPIQTAGNDNISKDLEIISAKLDSIKAAIDSLSTRLNNLERIADPNSAKSRYSW